MYTLTLCFRGPKAKFDHKTSLNAFYHSKICYHIHHAFKKYIVHMLSRNSSIPPDPQYTILKGINIATKIKKLSS